MPREQVEHMIQERHARADVAFARSVQIQFEVDVGFLGGAVDFSLAIHYCLEVSFCPRINTFRRTICKAPRPSATAMSTARAWQRHASLATAVAAHTSA